MLHNETPDEPRSIGPEKGKSLLIVGVGVLLLVVILDQLIGRTNLCILMVAIGVGSVIPLASAIWAVKRRGPSV